MKFLTYLLFLVSALVFSAIAVQGGSYSYVHETDLVSCDCSAGERCFYKGKRLRWLDLIFKETSTER
jgi:hypothetical protein